MNASGMADAMAAVKVQVYDCKAVSMAELLDALSEDFEGNERLRQMLLNRTPKYGNDDDQAEAAYVAPWRIQEYERLLLELTAMVRGAPSVARREMAALATAPPLAATFAGLEASADFDDAQGDVPEPRSAQEFQRRLEAAQIARGAQRQRDYAHTGDDAPPAREPAESLGKHGAPLTPEPTLRLVETGPLKPLWLRSPEGEWSDLQYDSGSSSIRPSARPTRS